MASDTWAPWHQKYLYGAFYLFPDFSEFLLPDGIRTTAGEQLIPFDALGPDDIVKVPTAIAVFAPQFVPEGEPPREWRARVR